MAASVVMSIGGMPQRLREKAADDIEERHSSSQRSPHLVAGRRSAGAAERLA
jgi:hypothetical protein